MCFECSPRLNLSDENVYSSIIAVHGIGAHPDDAWSKEADLGEDGKRRWVNWLKDESMLPSAVPNARIMRYGYESQWFGDSVIHTKVTDVARRLLRALQRLRKVCQLENEH